MRSERDSELMRICLEGGARQQAAGSGQQAKDGSEGTEVGSRRSEVRGQRSEKSELYVELLRITYNK